jgi:hypothetical protein
MTDLILKKIFFTFNKKMYDIFAFQSCNSSGFPAVLIAVGDNNKPIGSVRFNIDLLSIVFLHNQSKTWVDLCDLAFDKFNEQNWLSRILEVNDANIVFDDRINLP